MHKLRVFELPPVPDGEDQTSFDRHNRVLKAEYSKSHPNAKTVQELMKITFSMRRRDILSEGHVFDPLKKYLYLQQPSYVSVYVFYIVEGGIHDELNQRYTQRAERIFLPPSPK